MTVAEAWDQLESRYSENSYRGLPDGPGALHIDRGSSVLLIAAHPVSHHKSGKPKPADLFTGGLVELLGELSGTSVLTITKTPPVWDRWESRDDEFSRLLTAEAAGRTLVIDFHGMDDRHGLGLCFGVGLRPDSVALAAAATLTAAFPELVTAVGDPFPATAEHTVTARLHTVGVPCLQVEVASKLRQPNMSAPAATARFVERLAAAIHQIGVS